jgi:Uncharacterised nucleotidyltransferase
MAIDADLAWLLHAAFANAFVDPVPADDVRALHLARSTQLSGRIAKRLERWRGAPELTGLGAELDGDYYTNIAMEGLLTQALERIAGLADRRGVPIVALKFAGLRRAGVVTPGTRVASDIDLLLPKLEAKAFWQALLDVGFRRTQTHEYAHQLEALVDPYGAIVDLHVHVPYVSVEKRGFASAEQLMLHGLVRRSSGALFVLQPALLAAHAIAHALLQNRATPQTYSPLRMVSDIMDLRRVQADVVSAAASYLAPELRATCNALERLCVALSNGTFTGVGFDGTREQALLWHCLAARLDFEYSEELRAAGLMNKLRDGSSASEILRYVGDLIYPAEPALDALYGPAAGRLARVRRRLWRPVDLVARAARRWGRAHSR